VSNHSSDHSCGRRLPSDKELGWIRMIRRSSGQASLERLAAKRILEFCVCPQVFVKSQWLQEPLKLIVVVAHRFRDNPEKGVSMLNAVSRWLKEERLGASTDRTLRRMTEFGDEFLYGSDWSGGRSDDGKPLYLGDVIERSPKFLDYLDVGLRTAGTDRNQIRRQLSVVRTVISMLVETHPSNWNTFMIDRRLPEVPEWCTSVVDSELLEAYEDVLEY
jgi:hypothetical protein